MNEVSLKFGLTDQQYELMNNRLFEPLKKRNLKVYIFGSRAKGTQHKYSDIDILIDNTNQPAPEGELSSIKEWFENSNFPFKVDIVLQSDLASSYKEDVFSHRIEV